MGGNQKTRDERDQKIRDEKILVQVETQAQDQTRVPAAVRHQCYPMSHPREWSNH